MIYVYSVYNPSNGGYRVYESHTPLTPALNLSGANTLGSTPEDEVPDLPNDSKYVGESDKPQGVIVKTSYSITGFLLSAAAIVIANIIFHKYFK